MASLVAPPSARGERLDRFLSSAAALSRARVQALIEAGHVRLGDALAHAATRLKGGETLSWSVPEPVAAEPVAQDLPLTVLFEDRDLIAIDKAPGVVVHPGAGNRDGTLVNALLHHVKDLAGVGGVLRPGIVHRLDKDTSGVMIVAKNEAALKELQKAFASRDVEKVYLALVVGHPSESGTFDTLYGRHPRNRLKFSSQVKRGKRAVTHWRVVDTVGVAAQVEVQLETGRTHQIRVHFADVGFPLVGDALYGGRRAQLGVIARQALHAWRLNFRHPRTGKSVKLEAPVPGDFLAAVEQLR